MNITLKQAEKLMYPLLNNKIVPFLHSSPALGKSSLAKAVAAKAKLKVIDLRLTELDSSDLNGLPYFNEGKAQYLPFNTFPIQGTEVPEGCQGWLLLLDELNSALPSVQSAA
nr:AAA family ATPase [Moraxella catarrhalis]